MDLSQAVAECADLLNVAGSALKRVLQAKLSVEASEPVQGQVDEVLQIATRLQQLSQAMIAASIGSERDVRYRH